MDSPGKVDAMHVLCTTRSLYSRLDRFCQTLDARAIVLPTEVHLLRFRQDCVAVAAVFLVDSQHRSLGKFPLPRDATHG